MVQLYQKHKDEVACISVNLDYQGDDAEAVQQDVLQLLQEKQVTVQNIIKSDPDLNIQMKLGAFIPVALVYDQSGALRKAFHNGQGEYGEGGFTYQQHVIPFVEQLLAEGKSEQAEPGDPG